MPIQFREQSVSLPDVKRRVATANRCDRGEVSLDLREADDRGRRQRRDQQRDADHQDFRGLLHRTNG